ncbi:Reverse transcriptase domain-containing protein [Abeliophyllum distichum]|uniref:Reverse transcriptase domain-containing protein n=1 Tax=Abeliophyllum distichum TaxID=126358 RepID=A0ABD1NXS5_9LAMI
MMKLEISTFQQLDGERYHEAWDRFKELLRKCPNHDITPGTLPSNTVTNPKEQVQAIPTRSRVQLPEIHVKRPKKKDTQILVDDDGVEKQSVQPQEGDPKDSDESSKTQTQVPVKAYVLPIPFPQRLQKHKLDK